MSSQQNWSHPKKAFLDSFQRYRHQQQIVLNCRAETFLGSLDAGLAERFLDLQLMDVCERLDVVVQTVEALCQGAVYLCLRFRGGLIRPIWFDLYLIPPITDEQFLVEHCAIGTKSGVP